MCVCVRKCMRGGISEIELLRRPVSFYAAKLCRCVHKNKKTRTKKEAPAFHRTTVIENIFISFFFCAENVSKSQQMQAFRIAFVGALIFLCKTAMHASAVNYGRLAPEVRLSETGGEERHHRC